MSSGTSGVDDVSAADTYSLNAASGASDCDQHSIDDADIGAHLPAQVALPEEVATSPMADSWAATHVRHLPKAQQMLVAPCLVLPQRLHPHPYCSVVRARSRHKQRMPMAPIPQQSTVQLLEQYLAELEPTAPMQAGQLRHALAVAGVTRSERALSTTPTVATSRSEPPRVTAASTPSKRSRKDGKRAARRKRKAAQSENSQIGTLSALLEGKPRAKRGRKPQGRPAERIAPSWHSVDGPEPPKLRQPKERNNSSALFKAADSTASGVAGAAAAASDRTLVRAAVLLPPSKGESSNSSSSSGDECACLSTAVDDAVPAPHSCGSQGPVGRQAGGLPEHTQHAHHRGAERMHQSDNASRHDGSMNLHRWVENRHVSERCTAEQARAALQRQKSILFCVGDKQLLRSPSVGMAAVLRTTRSWVQQSQPDRARAVSRQTVQLVNHKIFSVQQQLGPMQAGVAGSM